MEQIKKAILCLLLAALLFSLCACASGANEPDTTAPAEKTEESVEAAPTETAADPDEAESSFEREVTAPEETFPADSEPSETETAPSEEVVIVLPDIEI